MKNSLVFRVTLLVMVILLALSSLLGCAPTTQPAEKVEEEKPVAEVQVATEKPAETKEEVVTITFWHIYTDAMAGANSWFVDMVTQFEEENPNIKVQMETFGSDPYKTKLPAALSSGEAADALHILPGNSMKPFIDSGALSPIDDALDEDGWREQFVPYTFDEVTFDGETYCLPFTLRTVHMWYNKDVFAKYNLEPPTTYDELIVIADTLKANGVTPFALGTKIAWQAMFWFNNLVERTAGYDAWLAAKNGEGLGWEDPGIIEALRIFQDLVAKGYFTEGTLGVDPMDVNQSFFDGSSAMILNGTFFPDQVKSLGPEGFLDNSLGYFNFPKIEGGKGNPKIQHGGVGAAYCVNAKSEHKEEVLKLYKFMFTSEHMQDIANRTNYVMSMKDSVPADASPMLKALAAEVENMDNYVWYTDHALEPEPYITFQATIQELMDQTITPEEAAAKMQQAYTQ